MVKLTTEDLDAAEQMLCDRFPKTFVRFQRERRPLKVGMFAELVARLDGAVAPRTLHAVMRRYTSNIGYLHSIRRGRDRVDLDGNIAGTTSAADRQNATERLMQIRLEKEKRAALPRPKMPAPPFAPVKRDGLGALREAARKRREASA
jgi:ProP effector